MSFGRRNGSMPYDHKEILRYWNQEHIESMYDKYLLNAEIEIIKSRIPSNVKILDAGCGEGEGTIAYSEIPGVRIHAADFSTTRLKKAATRLKGRGNVSLKKVDFLRKASLDSDYDIVISQRFLINFTDWEIQKKILLTLMEMLKAGGKLLMLEGSRQGVDSLNAFRAVWGLGPIPVKWHNLFFDDKELIEFMALHGYELLEEDGLGSYFLLTRGIRPNLDRELNWDCKFNKVASMRQIEDQLNFHTKFSRLKLWVFKA
jgi:ubiquinone/menaquinone biosynthesis C-methylase UbiE